MRSSEIVGIGGALLESNVCATLWFGGSDLGVSHEWASCTGNYIRVVVHLLWSGLCTLAL